MIVWPQTAHAEDVPSTMSVWTGISASQESLYLYAGTAYALSGDIDADGIIARIGLGGGQYETSGRHGHDVDHYDSSFMLGYRYAYESSVITLYAGIDNVQHHNVDPGSDLRGSAFGAKAQVEAYVPVTKAIYVSAFATYSTAFDTFNAAIKAAYRITDDFSLGPEVAALGTQGFDQTRTGLAAAYWVMDDAELAVSTGYAWPMDEDATGGIYGGINLYTKF